MSRHNDPPYFPFYPDDFACDGKVEAMTTEEVGAYTLLLCKAWREDPPGSIPDDDRVLALWTRLAPDRWTECRTGVLAAFTLGTDSRWHQKRMRREYEKFRVLKQKRVESARNAAHARYGGNHASRMRQAWESDAPRIRDACLSSSYSYTEKREEDISADSVEQLFGEFWEAYPRKEVPSQARKAFEKLKPDRQLLATILAWLIKAKLSKQWQESEFVPLPATFLNQKYWEGDTPPRATLRRTDTVGLSCAEPAGEYHCDICEGTGRLLVLFNRDNGTEGNAVGCVPWSPIRERLMAGEGQETRLFRCGCESGQLYPQLKSWTPETHFQGL